MRRTRRALGAGAALLAATLLAGCTAAAGAAPAAPAGATFTNPIVDPGFDPWVVHEGGRYLLVQSLDGGIWLTASRTLTGLGSGKRTRIWTYPVDGPASQAVWAPELHHVGGRWYVYFAATTADQDNANHRMFVLRSASDDPLSTWSDVGRVRGMGEHWAIDGTRLSWHGRDYFVWSGWPTGKDGRQSLYIARMGSPTSITGTPVLLSSADLPWEERGAPIEEGPEALQHDGHLFLVYSASGSWTDHYCLGLLRFTGQDPLRPGDWTKDPKPAFAGGHGVVAPGHASFTTSPDGREDWIVYHSARYPGAGWDRVVSTQRFTWDADGAPLLGTPVREDVPQRVPSGQRG